MTYTLTLTGDPLGPFSGTLEDFKDAILAGLHASISSDNIIVGKVGGTAPIEDVGPWLNGNTWYVWDGTDYVPATIKVGNASFQVTLGGLSSDTFTDAAVSSTSLTSATANFTDDDIGKTITGPLIPASTTITAVTSESTVTMSHAATSNATGQTFTIVGRTGTITANRSIQLQDKDGTLALLSDVYTPRPTNYPELVTYDALNDATTRTIIDWSLSESFALPLDRNVGLSMVNSVSGQEIFIVAFNEAGAVHTIKWPAEVHWTTSAAPVQTTGTISPVLTDAVTISSDPTLTSATANFTTEDVGRTVTGAGIPALTTIINVVDEQTVTLSANATASASSVSITIVNRSGKPDLYVLRNAGGQIYGKAIQGYI